MKEKTVFVCDICGEKHDTATLAELCERNHKKILSAEGLYSNYTDKNGYPDRVNITFEDGVVGKYRKICVG